MKGLSLEGRNGLANARLHFRSVGQKGPLITVERIAQKRATNMGHMDPDLVSASCFQPTFHFSDDWRANAGVFLLPETTQAFIVRDGVAPMI